MTTVIWVILGLALIVLIVYMAGKNRNKRVTTESTQKFPENQNPPRSAP